jgi:hypothetical protein
MGRVPTRARYTGSVKLDKAENRPSGPRLDPPRLTVERLRISATRSLAYKALKRGRDIDTRRNGGQDEDNREIFKVGMDARSA